MRKICVVTGTRAEYGLLYWLMKEIEADSELELQIICTGTHLSPEFGLTYRDIEENFKPNKKIEILLSSDTPIGISKSMGLAQISFAEAYEELAPDIVLVLGDRFEILSAVTAAMIQQIPIAHLNGGELTVGAIDDSIRHAITKMSHIHFVALEEYRKRVLQLGEKEDNVFNFGEVGLDNINRLNLLSKNNFEKSINFKLNKKNFLITYHPETLKKSNTIEHDFQNILDALDSLDNTHFIFTKSNADSGGRMINKMIDSYVIKNYEKSVVFTSLGQLRYLSALQYVDLVLGNSSSGIVEVPSFKIGTINIGDRQKGRVQAENVINCVPEKTEILKSVSIVYGKEFQNELKKVVNPYGDGFSSYKTKEVLKNINIENIILKEFRDIQ